MPIITVANRKGGTGKTTTAVNLAACLADVDHDVLLIDMDPQANATTSFGIPKATDGEGLIALLDGKKSLTQVKQDTGANSPRIIAAGPALAKLELEMPMREDWHTCLAEALVDHNHEFVILDAPPSMGTLNINALVATEGVLIPMQCDYLSLEGLHEFSANLRHVRDTMNPNLHLLALIKTMFDGRTTLAQEVATELDRYFGKKVLPTAVPRNVKLAEAPSHGKPVIRHAPSSSGARAYRAVTQEFLHALQ